MSDDKIKISWDDLGHSNSPKPQQPTYAPPPNYTQGPQTTYNYPDPAATNQPADKTGWLIGGIIAAILVVGLLAFCLWRGNSITPPPRQTVEEFCQEGIAEINAELAKFDSPVRKFIEDAHLTVTVYSAKVKSLVADTLDGTNFADDGKNISTVTMEIEFRWDGIIHKGGTSILEIIVDIQNEKLVRAEITYTDALINFEDPDFWYQVGFLIGAMAL